MKKLLVATVALAAFSTAAVAGPKKMTPAQMDNVTAGALINVVAVDVVDIQNVANNNKVAVAIPVNAAVAIGVLGGAIAGAAQGQPGRISQ